MYLNYNVLYLHVVMNVLCSYICNSSPLLLTKILRVAEIINGFSTLMLGV